MSAITGPRLLISAHDTGYQSAEAARDRGEKGHGFYVFIVEEYRKIPWITIKAP